MKHKDKQKKLTERNKKIKAKVKSLMAMGFNKTAALNKIADDEEYGNLSKRQLDNVCKEI